MDAPAPTKERTYYLGIDVETSGQGLGTNFMTQIGAAIVDVERGVTVATWESYVAQPEGRVWEERCVREFWSKPENAARWEETKAEVAAARPAAEVAAEFRAWVAEHGATPDDTTIIFDTAGFDQSWVDQMLGDGSCLYLLGGYKQPRDASSWYVGMGLRSPAENVDSESEAAADTWGIAWPEFHVKHDHHPAHDAELMVLRLAHASKIARLKRVWVADRERDLLQAAKRVQVGVGRAADDDGDHEFR